jgi:hypothetical protein
MSVEPLRPAFLPELVTGLVLSKDNSLARAAQDRHVARPIAACDAARDLVISNYPEVRLVLISVNDPAQVGDEGIDVFVLARSLRQRGGEHKQQQGLIVRKLFYSPMVTAASPTYLKRAGTPACLPTLLRIFVRHC